MISLNTVMPEVTELYPTGQPTTIPSPPAGLYIFSQCPQTLTAAGAEVWVGAHYSLVEPSQKEGRVFLKGVNWGFLFLGYFISYGQIRLHALCDLFHVSCVCHQQSPLVSSQPGSNFPSPSFNELLSWMSLFHWKIQNLILFLCLRTSHW